MGREALEAAAGAADGGYATNNFTDIFTVTNTHQLPRRRRRHKPARPLLPRPARALIPDCLNPRLGDSVMDASFSGAAIRGTKSRIRLCDRYGSINRVSHFFREFLYAKWFLHVTPQTFLEHLLGHGPFAAGQ